MSFGRFGLFAAVGPVLALVFLDNRNRVGERGIGAIGAKAQSFLMANLKQSAFFFFLLPNLNNGIFASYYYLLPAARFQYR